MMFSFLFVAWLAGQMPSLPAALADLNNGRILESILQLKQIVRSDPGNGPAWFYLSTLFTEMKEYESAERYLQRAMQAGPKQAVHYYQLGIIRYRQSQWHPALEAFEQALTIGAGQSEASVWRSTGDVQLELFDREAALRAYTEALRLEPNDARTRLALGRFYLQRGDTPMAIEHLRAAVEFDASLRAAYPVLGGAYLQAGELPAALAVLKKALEANPADQDSRYELGRVLLAMGRDREGREELDRYQRIRQQVAAADSNYRDALSRLAEGKFSEAESLLRETLRLAPSYGPALQSLGTLLVDRGSPEKAIPFLQRAVGVNPLNTAAWDSLSTAYLKTGKTREAREAAKRANALNEDLKK